MRHERPTDQTVRQTYRNARWFTAVALLGCVTIYVLIDHYTGGSPIATQARFNTVFQTLLIAAWVLFMFPYISVTLKSILYGIEINEKTSDFFSKPEKSPLIQFVEKKLSEQGNTQKELFEREILPAIQTWQRIGKTVEEQIPTLIQGMTEIREAAKKIDQAVQKNDNLAAEMKPAIDALKRIEAKVEDEIKTGLFENIRAATESVRGINGIPKVEETKPDLNTALSVIRKNKVVGRS